MPDRKDFSRGECVEGVTSAGAASGAPTRVRLSDRGHALFPSSASMYDRSMVSLEFHVSGSVELDGGCGVVEFVVGMKYRGDW